jgi:hypothetical protein
MCIKFRNNLIIIPISMNNSHTIKIEVGRILHYREGDFSLVWYISLFNFYMWRGGSTTVKVALD